MPHPILSPPLLPQPVWIGLIAALGMLTAALLGLVGVLVGTRINWKLGKRTGDIQQAGVGIQQQTVDIARNDKLFEENAELRKENQEQYTANRQLRHEAESWDQERRTLCRTADAAEEARRAAQGRVALLEAALARSEAECSIALAAQASAEGGLKTAMKTLAEIGPCSPGPGAS